MSKFLGIKSGKKSGNPKLKSSDGPLRIPSEDSDDDDARGPNRKLNFGATGNAIVTGAPNHLDLEESSLLQGS